MSIRITACYLYVLAFAWYGKRFWYISTCAAITLMAVIQHPDLPKSIGGIQGANPWNILFGSILIWWWYARRRLGWRWEMPPFINAFLLAYLLVVLISVGRMLDDPSAWSEPSVPGMVSEYIINGIKWVLPGLLLFDGCRNRRYALIAVGAILAIYFLLGVQVIRWVPLGSAKAARYISNEIGYNRVTLSMMLAGASWACACAALLFLKWKHRLLVFAAAASILFAQSLTGGRSGYIAWICVGLALGLIRWRKLLVFLPLTALIVIGFVPGVRERVFQGAAQEQGAIRVERDTYEMSSGRNLAWPVVIDKIKDSFLVGYGREGMYVSGAQQYLIDEYGESFPHPHHAYLEWLLDHGIVGFIVVMLFYVVVLFMSWQLLRDCDDPLVTVVGCICFALVLALLVAGFGGQTFYPREGSVGMWASMGLMLRFWVERKQQPHGRLFVEEDEQLLNQDEAERHDPVPA